MPQFSDTYTHLLVLAGDTSTLVDQVDVVGEERVAGVLGDDTERDENSQPPSVTLGLDKVDVAGVLVGIGFQTNDLPHLDVFELNRGVVTVTSGMVVGESVQGLFVALLGDQPTWAWKAMSAYIRYAVWCLTYSQEPTKGSRVGGTKAEPEAE